MVVWCVLVQLLQDPRNLHSAALHGARAVVAVNRIEVAAKVLEASKHDHGVVVRDPFPVLECEW